MSNQSDCDFNGCTRPAYRKGWCRYHYEQDRTGKTLTPSPDKKPKQTGCTVGSCEGKHYAKGKCKYHYMASIRPATGPPLPKRGKQVVSIALQLIEEEVELTAGDKTQLKLQLKNLYWLAVDKPNKVVTEAPHA